MKQTGLIIVLFAANILWAGDLDQGLTTIGEKIDRFNILLGNQDLDAESKREQLSKVIENAVDFDAISQRALGPLASELTPEQNHCNELSKPDRCFGGSRQIG